MQRKSPVFERNYDFYLQKIKALDLESQAERIGAQFSKGELIIPLLNAAYRVSEKGVSDPQGEKPYYAVCIVLFKYILSQPLGPCTESGWSAYREFKDAAPLTGFFLNDVEKPLAEHFTGKTDRLETACEKLNGKKPNLDLTHDIARQFWVLPRAPILFLFNDADDEFPAAVSVLFKKSVKNYLDMESAAIMAQIFTNKLIQTDKGE